VNDIQGGEGSQWRAEKSKTERKNRNQPPEAAPRVWAREGTVFQSHRRSKETRTFGEGGKGGKAAGRGRGRCNRTVTEGLLVVEGATVFARKALSHNCHTNTVELTQ